MINWAEKKRGDAEKKSKLARKKHTKETITAAVSHCTNQTIEQQTKQRKKKKKKQIIMLTNEKSHIRTRKSLLIYVFVSTTLNIVRYEYVHSTHTQAYCGCGYYHWSQVIILNLLFSRFIYCFESASITCRPISTGLHYVVINTMKMRNFLLICY